VRQAAAQAGLSRRTVFRAVGTGHLPATRATGRWLITPADLGAWLDRVGRGLQDVAAGPSDPARLSRVRAVAAVLGVSRQRVYQLLEQGVLAAVETDGGRCVRGADLIAWRGIDEVPEAPGREE
jgi:excisionase family DNA binding protein